MKSSLFLTHSCDCPCILPCYNESPFDQKLVRPLAQSEGHHAPRLIDELVPGLATMVDEIVVPKCPALKPVENVWQYGSVMMVTVAGTTRRVDMCQPTRGRRVQRLRRSPRGAGSSLRYCRPAGSGLRPCLTSGKTTLETLENHRKAPVTSPIQMRFEVKRSFRRRVRTVYSALARAGNSRRRTSINALAHAR
jgi:hypothetical protein